MPSNEWSFEQLAGDRTRLVLNGWSAPFGRPRHDAVVEEEINVRENETYYQDNPAPTRHDFGMRYEPWTLHGRWMDVELGPGGANAKALEWKRFVHGRQRVAVRWGEIVAYKGFITKLKLGREGRADIAWQLEIKLDEDEDLAGVRLQAPTPSATRLADDLDAMLRVWLSQLPTISNGVDVLGAFAALREDFLDTVDALVSAVNAPSARLLSALEAIEDFDDALVGDLKRVRAGAGQTKTAVLDLRDSFEANQNDAILFSRTGDIDVAWAAQKSAIDVTTNEILALLADLDRQAEIAERSRASSSVVAVQGDTWEAMSTRAYGSHEQADDIRQANGVRYGERPMPGRSYVLPGT